MKRILFLGDVNSSHVIKWVTSVSEKGFEVGLFTLSFPVDDWYSSKGISVFEAGHFSKDFFSSSLISKLKYLKFTGKLKQTISLFKPDIIHAHYATSYGLLGALSGFRPLLISVWGSDVFDFPKKSIFHKAMLVYNLNRAERLFSASKVLALATSKISKRSIYIIPFGVDTDFFAPLADRKYLEGRITIGTVKALERIYGIDVLIRAFKVVIDRNPRLDIKLLIVGGGSQLQELQKLAENLSLTDKVTFEGRIDYKDIPFYYKQIDIFANLSRHESFGVSVLEAMACGKPVVVSSAGGLPELVSNGKTGLIVSPEDETSAADAFQRLLDDDQFAITLGKDAREHVKRDFDWNRSVEIMINHYNEVLADK